MKKYTKESVCDHLDRDCNPETAIIHPDSPLARAVYTHSGFQLPFRSNDAFRKIAYALIEASKHRLISYRETLPRDVLLYLKSLMEDMEKTTDVETFKSLAYTIETSFKDKIKDVEKIKRMLTEKRTEDLKHEPGYE